MGQAQLAAAICAAAFWFTLLPGCKPAAQSPASRTAAAEPKHGTVSPVSAEPGEVPPALTSEKVIGLHASPEAGESVAQLASIEQRYLAFADPETRIELMGEVTAAENPVAVELLGRLFQNERDADLKVALLAAVMVQEEQPAERLAVFAGGLWPLQPQSVRFMAVEGLAALRTPAAIQMLQGLQFDADREIRAAAAEALGR